jgi:hypothetical protein
MSDYLGGVIQQALDWDYARARSQQKEAGWSGMSGCRAYLGFVYRGDWATDDVDNWAAIRGTAMHAWLTEVRREACDGLDMAFDGDPDGSVSYMGVPGHVDEIDYGSGVITDYKFPALKSARYWLDPLVQEEKFVQPHGYGAAIISTRRWREAAERAGRDPDKATVQLLVCPVDGVFGDWMLFERQLDTSVAVQAVARYAVVKEASDRGDPLPRDKERYWCDRFCEFRTACRGARSDRDGSELEEILDEEHAAAVEAYGLALEAERDVTTAKENAAALIRGLEGTARGWKVGLSKQGKQKEVPDMDGIREDYASSGVEMPMTVADGAAPRLSVTRVVPDKAPARKRKPAAASSNPVS